MNYQDIFTWIDWIIIALILISSLMSLKRGFFKEVLSITVWIISSIIAWRYGAVYSDYLDPFIETPSLRIIITSLLLFLFILFSGTLLTNSFVKLIQTTGLTGTDRFLGLIFGGFRGLIIATFLVGLIRYAPIEQDPSWKNSRFIPYLSTWANIGKKFVKGNFGSFINF